MFFEIKFFSTETDGKDEENTVSSGSPMTTENDTTKGLENSRSYPVCRILRCLHFNSIIHLKI